MTKRPNTEDIFRIDSEESFLDFALAVFHYQYETNAVYGEFCRQVGKSPNNVKDVEDIPFLPISFFKSHEVYSGEKGSLIFTSSGTTGQITSKHFVQEPSIYEESFLRAFEDVYGSTKGKCILGLLPSYLEREGSSLVYMVDQLISKSENSKSGFYLKKYEAFCERVNEAIESGDEVIIFGVSYALLDLAEGLKPDLSNAIVIETGGMKGQRKEISKKEMHSILKEGLNLRKVHSEYGMTELLSQAYSEGDELFHTPSWMKIMLRQVNDPFSYTTSKTGGINVIDLANIDSCAFIATEDLGRFEGDSFKVLGRSQAADIRGCNLMYDY
ncbi:MAG: acyl transferase [Crocinitomicaceae bacterium]|nr:acyl transferase [Crocinitomicaceae bacterium]